MATFKPEKSVPSVPCFRVELDAQEARALGVQGPLAFEVSIDMTSMMDLYRRAAKSRRGRSVEAGGALEVKRVQATRAPRRCQACGETGPHDDRCEMRQVAGPVVTNRL